MIPRKSNCQPKVLSTQKDSLQKEGKRLGVQLKCLSVGFNPKYCKKKKKRQNNMLLTNAQGKRIKRNTDRSSSSRRKPIPLQNHENVMGRELLGLMF
jgi:hypothetical protein